MESNRTEGTKFGDGDIKEWRIQVEISLISSLQKTITLFLLTTQLFFYKV